MRRTRTLDNIGLTGADNFMHHFPSHFHEEYSIGIALNGIQAFQFREREYIVKPLSLFLIPPEQVHAHHPIAEIGWSFRSMYLSPDLIRKLVPQEDLSHFTSISYPICSDRSLINGFLQLHNYLNQGENESKPVNAGIQKGMLQQLVSGLFRQIGHSADQDESQEAPGITEAVKTYLKMHFNEKVRLEEIARLFKTDKFRLIRLFSRQTGVTPYNYLMILRIEKARQLIGRQYPLASAALEAGFYDQSHFHHFFQQYTGLTPGQYQHFESRQDLEAAL